MAKIRAIATHVTLEYRMKKNSLNTLYDLFLKKKVLTIGCVIEVVNATSRVTAYRYLKKLDYLSSYTHARQFYTLRTIPEFDEDGLWHFKDIGFSIHGTLVETIIYLVHHSKSGRTCVDLEKQQHTYVQNALLNLIKMEKIQREEQNGIYVYYSSNPEIAHKQKERRHVTGGKRLPNWIVAEVLTESLKSLTGIPCIEDVLTRLSKRGSLITREQVEQVFEEHGLEKKTLD